LRELAHADLERECRAYKSRSGEVVIRQASPEELKKYRAIANITRKRKGLKLL
jgi:hypothetical protein